MAEQVALSSAVVGQLKEFCKQADKIETGAGLGRWATQVGSFLITAVGRAEAMQFYGLQDSDAWGQHAMQMGHVQGLIAKSEASRRRAASSSEIRPEHTSSQRVFVVHGHDNEAKESAARFLGKLGLTPVILHEQPNLGRTIIEKFETYSDDVAFAIVLLTPDDRGGSKSTGGDLQARARQNVVLELGYFMGRLGRSRVCALHKQGVELPSDYQGIVYVEMDAGGAWKPKLAQELIEAKISIELSGLVGG